MDCYKEFAHIYDELINSDVDYEAFGNYILEMCTKYNLIKNNYLDLACGTGNLTKIIYKSFKCNFAVDISEEMLTEAEGKIKNVSNKPKFICQDICNLHINKNFDLITCCLDSINYVIDEEELKSLFSNVSKHLNPSGIFIFDINSHYKIKHILGNNIFTYDNEDVFYTWENQFDGEIVDMFLTFFVKEGDLYRRIDEQHSERAYTTEYILGMLDQFGMEMLELNDCYENKSVSEETERITFVARLKQ